MKNNVVTINEPRLPSMVLLGLIFFANGCFPSVIPTINAEVSVIKIPIIIMKIRLISKLS